MDILSETLMSGAPLFDITISEQCAAQFTKYYEILEQQNRITNLTSITGKLETAQLHFLDSLSLFLTGRLKDAEIIDIGSGAGFPGVPLRLADSSIKLTLIDSSGKRVSFLDTLCSKLDIADVRILQARAEDASHEPELRGCFDVAVSRAVARLNVLCELCIPFVKTGGYFFAMKGIKSPDEISESARAVQLLGGEFIETINYSIPGNSASRCIYVISKTTETPECYPRRFSKIQKNPLC